MINKIRTFIWLLFICIFFINTKHVKAASIEDYDFDEIDDTISEYEISFMDVAKEIMEGNTKQAFNLIGKAIYNNMFSDFNLVKKNLINIVIIGIICILIKNVSITVNNGYSLKIGRYIMWLSLVLIMCEGINFSVNLSKEVIYNILDFMKVIMPTFALVITAGSGSVSALGFYELVMLIVLIVEYISLKIVIPGTTIYMFINMMNYVSKESVFSKFSELLKEIINWINKTMIAVVFGLNLIKGIITPMLDSINTKTASRLISLIPGAGDVVNVVAGVVVGSCVIIKNTFGVCSILLLVMMCAVPVIKLFVLAFGCKAISALLEPVSDKSYVECVNGAYEGYKLIMSCVLNSLVLFMITLAIICTSTNAAFYSGK